MDREILKDTFLGMLQIMQADIIKLSDVAESSARQEAMNIVNSGGGYNTTSPMGKNLSYAGVVHSNLTIPLAMSCFSIMDLLGKIISNDIADPNDEGSQQSDSFIIHARAFEKMFKREYLKNQRNLLVI